MNLAQIIDAVPVVTTTVERDTRYSAPPLNQRVHNLESGDIQRFTSSGWTSDFVSQTIIGVINVRAAPYLAKGNGGTDDWDAIQSAIDDGHAGEILFFPYGQYVVGQTLSVGVRGFKFLGVGFDQSGIHYTGVGACIELGTDDGNPYDASEYNGPCQGFAYEGMSLDYTGAAVALNNGLGNYGVGTIGIRDWRSGSIRINRASFSGWDYPFWGIQSDIDYVSDIILMHNHRGMFFGPRSDQLRIDHVWSIQNDVVFSFEGISEVLASHWASDGDGSATTNPVKIRNSVYSVTRRCGGIVFDTPWLESLDGGVLDVEAFFDIGGGDAQPNATLVVRNPSVFVNLYSTGGVRHTKYLVRCDNVKSVVVDGIHGSPGAIPWNNLQAVFKVVNDGASAAVPSVFLNDWDGVGGRLIENYSATVCFVRMQGPIDQSNYTVNTVGGTGGVRVGLLSLQRNLAHSNAAPSAGVWNGGDLTLNRTWVQGTSNIFGWLAGGGSPGHHYPLVWPSIGVDRGDAAATLAVASDHMHQRWATPLTVPRAITLSATGADNGTMWFITREAAATGASGLDVGGLKTLAAGQWCIVMYDGGAYRLRAFGSL